MTVVHWSPVFVKKERMDVLVDSLRYCIENKGLNVFAYCIMKTHLHMLVNTDDPHHLKDTIRDFKKFVTKRIVNLLKTERDEESVRLLKLFSHEARFSAKHARYKLWMVGNHAIEVSDEKMAWIKINYIHNNPVKAGYVPYHYNWEYSSASNYYDKPSILPAVICLPPRLSTF